ncbi:hypothetical protein NESM_000460100 [Novymonas esmeraldas]|uniref:Uncharacterized protein n=1 Tax=Novymonas esmeraldas TaxID=1808958 RepID=A0AAW0EP58_9TRYP
MGISCTRAAEVLTPTSVAKAVVCQSDVVLRDAATSCGSEGPTSQHVRRVVPLRVDACVGNDDSDEYWRRHCEPAETPRSTPPLVMASSRRSSGDGGEARVPESRTVSPSSPLPATRLSSDGYANQEPRNSPPRTPLFAMYEIIHKDVDDNVYSVEPFQSTYGLHRTNDVVPDNFRAMVNESHAAAAATPQATMTATTCDFSDDEDIHEAPTTPPQTEVHMPLAHPSAVKALSRRSLCTLRRGSASSGVSRRGGPSGPVHPGRMSYTSFFALNLQLQPESLCSSESRGDTSSMFAHLVGDGDEDEVEVEEEEEEEVLQTEEHMCTDSSGSSSLSRQPTFGVLVPIGHSQVVDNAADGGVWEPALVQRGESLNVRRPWRKSGSPMTKSAIVAAHRRQLPGHELESRHMHPVLRTKEHGTATRLSMSAKMARASPRAPSRTGRQWPQPILDGPKSTVSRSRPFDAAGVFGGSIPGARHVPSPDWSRLNAMDDRECTRLDAVAEARPIRPVYRERTHTQ